ncbi:MAG: (Fe-S)-binding protein [Dehalococcoidia bacterium]|nr:(Fe-S)-binding protein [Dehalococcoidia bacterium]
MQDYEREITGTRINLCLDCGKCTVVCPVARYDPEFNPRLIAQRRISRNRNSVPDETIWSCVNCYMCTERCNYHVNFPEFVRILRAEALDAGAQLHCTHGGSTQALMRLMARPDLQQKRLDWVPPDIAVSDSKETIFFTGCAPYFDVLFSELDVHTIDGVRGALRLLNRARIPFSLLVNERCCGRDLLLQGNREGFRALAMANMDEFTARGVKKIITNCPECYYTLKVDYPGMLGATGIEVVHVTEALGPALKSGELTLGQIEKKVTYHDPCALGRCLRIFDQPRKVLEAIGGLQQVEMEQSREKALCCGASAWVKCGAVNYAIQEQRLLQASASGADILVTSCPKCQIHLACAQSSRGNKHTRIEIRDLADLAARSIGGESVV